MSGDNMSSFVTSLVENLNSTALWTEAGYAIPLITGIAVFVFGYTLVRRITKGAAKGKFKM